MGKSLKNIIGAGVIIGSLGLGSGLTGCATFYEDPFVDAIIGVQPKFLQPGAYRDLQERKVRKRYDLRTPEEKRAVIEEEWKEMMEEREWEEKGRPIYEVTNLDTNKIVEFKREELPKVYMRGQFLGGGFPKNGYSIVTKKNGEVFSKRKVIDIKRTGNSFQLIYQE